MPDLTIKGFETALRKAVPNWDKNRLKVYKVNKDYADLVMIIDGKLFSVKVYYRSLDDTKYYVEKLKEYFDTGKWDNHTYHVKYAGKAPQDGDYSRVFMVSSDDKVTKILTLIRNTEGDKECGLKQVPKGSFTVTPITVR